MLLELVGSNVIGNGLTPHIYCMLQLIMNLLSIDCMPGFTLHVCLFLVNQSFRVPLRSERERLISSIKESVIAIV